MRRYSSRCGFNTQPPEGGWEIIYNGKEIKGSFNTQPPEGGWGRQKFTVPLVKVSTHSRPKAAG